MIIINFVLNLTTSFGTLTDDQYNNLIADLYDNVIVYGGQTFRLKSKTASTLTYTTTGDIMEGDVGIALPDITIEVSTKQYNYHGYSYTPAIPTVGTYIHFITITINASGGQINFYYSSYSEHSYIDDEEADIK